LAAFEVITEAEHAKNAPTTLFGTRFMWNVRVDSKADPAISLVGIAEQKLISGFLA